jgi:hypothetical protein
MAHDAPKPASCFEHLLGMQYSVSDVNMTLWLYNCSDWKLRVAWGVPKVSSDEFNCSYWIAHGCWVVWGPDVAADVWYTITRLQQFFFWQAIAVRCPQKASIPRTNWSCLARGSDSDGGWNLWLVRWQTGEVTDPASFLEVSWDDERVEVNQARRAASSDDDTTESQSRWLRDGRCRASYAAPPYSQCSRPDRRPPSTVAARQAVSCTGQ